MFQFLPFKDQSALSFSEPDMPLFMSAISLVKAGRGQLMLFLIVLFINFKQARMIRTPAKRVSMMTTWSNWEAFTL